MIIQTTKEINGVVYAYTYSDSGFMIERDGVRYSEAVDPLDSGRVYTETDEPVDPPPTTEERVAALEAENKLLKEQVSAQADQAEFYEDCIAEMAAVVYA